MKSKRQLRRENMEAQARWVARQREKGEEKIHYCPTREQRNWIKCESERRGVSQQTVIREAINGTMSRGETQNLAVETTSPKSKQTRAKTSGEKSKRILETADQESLVYIRKRLTAEVGRRRKLLPPDHPLHKGSGGRGKDIVNRGPQMLIKPGVKVKDVISDRTKAIRKQIEYWQDLGREVASHNGREEEKRFLALVAQIIQQAGAIK